MYCKTCGKEINDYAVVCPYCGCATNNTPGTEVKEEKNGFAIAGFVCSFISPLLGWIFGGIGLAKANKPNGKNKGWATAAIIISSVNFFITLLIP